MEELSFQTEWQKKCPKYIPGVNHCHPKESMRLLYKNDFVCHTNAVYV